MKTIESVFTPRKASVNFDMYIERIALERQLYRALRDKRQIGLHASYRF